MEKKRFSEPELKAIEARFKASLGTDLFLFDIGGSLHIVQRVGMARSGTGPVLMVTGVHREAFRRHVIKDNEKALALLERLQTVVLPSEFEGVPVDVWGDD